MEKMPYHDGITTLPTPQGTAHAPEVVQSDWKSARPVLTAETITLRALRSLRWAGRWDAETAAAEGS